MENFFNNTCLFGEETLNSLHIYGSTVLDYAMIWITRLGGQLFFLTVLPVMYWCYDKKRAIQIGSVFLLASFVNTEAKAFFNNPRPDPAKLAPPISDLYNAYSPKSPGFPSGHTQGTVAFWGGASYYIRKPAVLITGIVLMILVPYSRLYLGVHFTGDVLGGYVLGGISLVLFIPLVNILKKNLGELRRAATVAVINVLPWAVHLVLPDMYLLRITGIAAGLATGIVLDKGTIVFHVKNSLTGNIVKTIIGLCGIILIYWSIKKILHGNYAAFFRYWFLGIWITLGGPLLFSRISFLKGWNPEEP